MLKVSKIYDRIKSDKINIKKEGDYYSLEVNGVKVREKLENIFIYGENLFILVSKGKFGAVQYDDSLNEIQSLPCVYDTLDEYWHNLVFSKRDEVVYYNATSKEWIPLLDIYIDGVNTVNNRYIENTKLLKSALEELKQKYSVERIIDAIFNKIYFVELTTEDIQY